MAKIGTFHAKRRKFGNYLYSMIFKTSCPKYIPFFLDNVYLSIRQQLFKMLLLPDAPVDFLET